MKPTKSNLDKRLLGVVHRIRQLREARGYSQDEFAEIIQTGRAHYGRIERGEINLKLQTLFKIADALAISADALLRDHQS